LEGTGVSVGMRRQVQRMRQRSGRGDK